MNGPIGVMRPVVGFGRGGAASLDAATKAYVARVGNNTLIDIKSVNQFHVALRNGGIINNLIHGFVNYGGFILRNPSTTKDVTTIFDLVSSDNNYTQGSETAQPKLETNGIKFDGSNDIMSSAFGMSSDNPFTICIKQYTTSYLDNLCVGMIKNTKAGTPTPMYVGLTIPTSTYSYYMFGSSDGLFARLRGTDDIRTVFTDAFSTVAYNGTTIWFNATPMTMAAGGSLIAKTNTSFIGAAENARWFNGWIKGYCIFNKSLSAAEQAIVMGVL